MRRALAVLLAAALTACTGQPSEDPPPAEPSPALSETLSCANAVKTGPLPDWARAGFTPPDTPVPHVVGERGGIVGVVFGHPLHAPRPEPGRRNKILWVANPALTTDTPGGAGTGALRIQATLNRSGLTADREVDLGPSLVDMPRPGCWTFTLSWAGHQDQVAVPYEPS